MLQQYLVVGPVSAEFRKGTRPPHNTKGTKKKPVKWTVSKHETVEAALSVVAKSEALPATDKSAAAASSHPCPAVDSAAPSAAAAAKPQLQEAVWPSSPVMRLSSANAAIAKEYSLGEKMGGGTFGVVHLGTHLSSGTRVAIKKALQQSGKGSVDLFADMVAEAACLERCRGHPSIVQLLDAWHAGPNGYPHLVFELWGCDLNDPRWHLAGGLGPKSLRAIVRSVASGLSFLHGVGLIHADVKPANVLAKQASSPDILEVKLSDFGGVVEVMGQQILRNPWHTHSATRLPLVFPRPMTFSWGSNRGPLAMPSCC